MFKLENGKIVVGKKNEDVEVKAEETKAPEPAPVKEPEPVAEVKEEPQAEEKIPFFLDVIVRGVSLRTVFDSEDEAFLTLNEILDKRSRNELIFLGESHIVPSEKIDYFVMSPFESEEN